MNIDDLIADYHAKPSPTLKVGSADWDKNEYLAGQFLEILVAHMESIKVFMPNPKQHDKFIRAIDLQLNNLLMRAVDGEQYAKLVKEKEDLEKKIERLKNELT